ncbi:hypothetical protein LIER_17160 [Lithospermum erythrorhizon]|uniref:Uncharacterized protein n=1 Tax=Lithospermum erythrorhizon TaxID=34254 RepID=A0AAV3QDN5_LITER
MRAKDGKAIVPHQVSYLDPISGNRFADRMLIAVTTPSGAGPSTTALSTDELTEEQMPLDERSSPQLPIEQPSTTPYMVFIPTVSSSLPDALGSSNLPQRIPSWNVIEGSSKAPQGLAGWSSIEKGFEKNHPFSVDLPYTLPLGLQVTQDTVSKPSASVATELLKNYMLRPSVLGVLGTQPSSLFDRFSYHQIKATKVAYSLSLLLDEASRCDNEVVWLKHSERESLLVDAREASKVYKSEGERLKKHIRELQAEVNEFKFHTIENQALLKGFNDKVGAMEIEIEDLKKALGTSVERFKRSEEYRSLIKGDTATVLRSFCQRVSADLLEIRDYVVSLFDELSAEEPAKSKEDCDSGSGEDEADEES